MSVKKRDAIEALKRALAGSQDRTGTSKIDFVSLQEDANALPDPASPNPQTPEFEVADWHFFSKTGLWEDDLTDGGDADFRAPDNKYVGLAWTASGTSKYQFDFTTSVWPMLYVEVPRPVMSWNDLRVQIEPLMAEINAEYLRRANRE